jgi:hypothetical protein
LVVFDPAAGVTTPEARDASLKARIS